MPRDPTLHRVRPEPVPGTPVTLTPQEQAELDRMLIRWEQQGASVRKFECDFTRIDFDGVFSTSDKPSAILKGEIRYAAPDKGFYEVKGEVVGYRWTNSQAEGGQFVKDRQAERWICNGKSIFEYDFQNRRLVEYQLPPELQDGRALSEGPLPFVFGAKAGYLKKRYFLKLVTPPDARGVVWLEAHPKFQADAANFQKATLILTENSMQPAALETWLPNGKSRTLYLFDRPRVNARNPMDPAGLFENNWLHVRTPRGWAKVVEAGPQSQAQRPSPRNPTR
jgi:TIGR03009 family protein